MLPRTILTFAVGFLFGLGTAAALAHELSLSSHRGTLGILGALGFLLIVVLWGWSRRIERHPVDASRAGEVAAHSREWMRFLWASWSLLLAYLALAIAVFAL